MKFIVRSPLVLLLLFCLETKAQRKFGVGLSTSLFPSSNPGLPLTPSLFYQHNQHEFTAGVNLYGGQLGFASIIGAEADYRFHFQQFARNCNVFASLNFQYVRFATGPARNVPFSYSEFIMPGLNYSMIQMRTFNNTLGIGLRYSFWKICGLHINTGIGYHYLRNTITEGVSASYVNASQIHSGFKIGYIFKIGLSATLVGGAVR